MKNVKYFFGFFLIAILSCSQQDDNTTSVNSKSFEKTLNKNNIDISKYHNPISLEGNIKVWVNKNQELVAYTETDTHIHIFLLQYLQTKFNPDENFNRISFLDHSFSLITDSGKNILCEVKDKDESQLAGNDLKQISGISNFETIIGGGVAHIWLDKNEIEKLGIDYKYDNIKSNNSVYDAFEKDGNLTGTGCSSGGQGSSSCSISGCSVSCSTGYYACCNSGGTFTGPTCKCIPNVPVIE